jgi:glutathione peroxidase
MASPGSIVHHLEKGTAVTASVGDITVKTPHGQDRSLGAYAGHVLLIVNVASRCGYTPQYAGLEELNRTYRDQGLRVLGFPCNDFAGQEPGTNEEIAAFCQTTYGVSFELFDKVHALGPGQHPLYTRLTREADPPGEVEWNFEKFLIGRDGQIVRRFKSAVTPNDPDVIQAIERALQA